MGSAPQKKSFPRVSFSRQLATISDSSTDNDANVAVNQSERPPQKINLQRLSTISALSSASDLLDVMDTFDDDQQYTGRAEENTSSVQGSAPRRPTLRLSSRSSIEFFEMREKMLSVADRSEPLTDENSGIIALHRDRISAMACLTNTVIAFRPSNADCLLPLKYGYPGKSLDIHDKSSKLGPLKGFIPVNVNLNKKSSTTANAYYVRTQAHHKARITQLYLKPELLAERYANNEINNVPYNSLKKADQKAIDNFIKNSENPKLTLSDVTIVKHANPDTNIPNHQTVFLLTKNEYQESKVWHVQHPTEGKPKGEAPPQREDEITQATVIPTEVWAYEKQDAEHGVLRDTPTTGDYDLAFTAPSRDLAENDNFEALNITVREFESDHGTYTCTNATHDMMELLNTMLESDLVVHGDEMNNDKFTQPMDDNYVVFQPNETSFLLDAEDLGEYLGSINEKYVTQMNSNWGNLESPSLSGERLYQEGRKLVIAPARRGTLQELDETKIKAARGLIAFERDCMRSNSFSEDSLDRRALGKQFLVQQKLTSKLHGGLIYTDDKMLDFLDDQNRKLKTLVNYEINSTSSDSSNTESAKPDSTSKQEE